jgi:hypothetical protein
MLLSRPHYARASVPQKCDAAPWELYSLANGLADYEYDARQVSFWSVAKIVNGAKEDPSLSVAFADFLIDSWYFRLGRSAERPATGSEAGYR